MSDDKNLPLKERLLRFWLFGTGRDTLRGWLNRHSGLALAAAAVVIVVSGLVVSWAMAPPPEDPYASVVYYYDMNKGLLFPGPRDEIPPILPESGVLPGSQMPAGARAHVFTCGECGPPDQFVGYLEIYPQKSHAVRRRIQDQQADPESAPPRVTDEELKLLQMGPAIRRPTGNMNDMSQWVAPQSEEAAKILDEIARRCPDGRAPRPCQPGD
ncbi:MAG: hypothetical protein R3336_05290 [Phycisphaeraceae bacterium]|nr:hypothetical protein [Phycisphaeraceae bacterium]